MGSSETYQEKSRSVFLFDLSAKAHRDKGSRGERRVSRTGQLRVGRCNVKGKPVGEERVGGRSRWARDRPKRQSY